MCSLISERILDIGSTTSPGHGSGSGPCATGALGAPTRGGAFAPDARKSRRSFFVTRPAMPLPLNALSSTPCSAAMRRTSGEDFVRRRSSSELAPLPCDEALTTAAVRCRLGGSAGANSLRGGPPAGAALAWAAAGSAGAGAAAPAPTAAFTSVSSRATTVCTATVSPSFTRISASTPADGDGISASTLSVEISKIGSSRFTESPTFFNHFDNVPSAIDSPIWGITTSMRATDSPSVGVCARPAAAEQPQRHHRNQDEPNDRAVHGIREPAAWRPRLRLRPTPRECTDDLGDQHRDHPAAGQADERGETPDTKILPLRGVRLPPGRRSPLPVLGSHQYSRTARAARTMSARCGRT